MKSDINRLMHEFGLDAIFVIGDEAPNPYRDYLTNRARAGGNLIKKRDEEAVFIVSGMEVDEAAKSGLKVMTPYDFGLADLSEQNKDNPNVIARLLMENYLKKLEVKGRVAFYGVADVGDTLFKLGGVSELAPEIEVVVGGEARKLFSRAYETKDPEEIAALREVAKLTSEVVRRTWAFISGHQAAGDEIGRPVLNGSGEPLTIGAVKRFIRLQEFELGLNDPDGCIFAQGRDAGMPHSHGEEDDTLQVGRSIVFDIYPRGMQTGYYADMTRTWCIGQAPEEVRRAYDDVMMVFHGVADSLRAGEKAATYQTIALDYFEGRGHPTKRSRPGTLEGYVHGLGHGLGLNIHEAPGMSELSNDVLAPGNVFTVEPGLYYPERDYGVRVEDTVYFDEAGRLHTLSDFPYDLVLPLKGG